MAVFQIEEENISAESLRQRKVAVDDIEIFHLSQVQWYECTTAAEYRHMRLEGSDGFPKPYQDPDAVMITINSKDTHPIALRVFKPKKNGKSSGVLIHFHAGGFVIGSARSYDTLLRDLAESVSMTVVSVEYRLAPENPYPMGQNDCLDATLFALSPEGEEELGGPLRIIAVWVAVALRDVHGIKLREQTKIAALVPSYGLFDMTYTPSVVNHKRRALLGKEDTERFVEAEFGKIPLAERKVPLVSPLYADYSGMPPALFIVGSEDPLLDDTLFIASKWHQAGNESTVKIFQAACHGFTLFPVADSTQAGKDAIVEYIKKHVI
ncbi:carboxylesterase [Xylogone sp. PMI_703]|nr:carboxylesterase [Xylogone sp. PMI_703]